MPTQTKGTALVVDSEGAPIVADDNGGSWLRSNLFQIVSAIGLALIMLGQWQERSSGDSAMLRASERRISRLEEQVQQMTSQERSRLDGIYQRRDMSDEQLRAIVAQLAKLDTRLERIEGRLR